MTSRHHEEYYLHHKLHSLTPWGRPQKWDRGLGCCVMHNEFAKFEPVNEHKIKWPLSPGLWHKNGGTKVCFDLEQNGLRMANNIKGPGSLTLVHYGAPGSQQRRYEENKSPIPTITMGRNHQWWGKERAKKDGPRNKTKVSQNILSSADKISPPVSNVETQEVKNDKQKHK